MLPPISFQRAEFPKPLHFVSNQKLKIDTDIYLVDSYGISSKFYSLTNVAFVGGSLISHGGQNPLEPARFGNFIINGPHVNNFKEIYSFLKKNKKKPIKKRANTPLRNIT